MKIAMPIWQNRLSPVFDASRKLCVINFDETGKEEKREVVDVPDGNISQRVSLLAGLEIEILVCGAVSTPLAQMIVSAGIRLIPFVAGEIETVVAALLRGELPSDAYTMPGCGVRRRRRRRGANR